MRCVLLLLLFALPVAAQEYAICMGGSGHGTAVFAIQHEGKTALTFGARAGKGTVIEPSGRVHDRTLGIETVTFAGLPVGVDHELFVIRESKIVDRRTFRVPDAAAAKGRILIASCLDDVFEKEQKQIWGEALAHGPDAIFLIGDNCYADVANGRLVRDITPAKLAARHAETRARLALFRAARLVPIFSVWDDHDYGLNNAGREFVHKRASKRIFRTYFPQPEIDGFLEHGPGLSSSFALFGQRWIFLDGRTFRSPNRNPVPDETVFGAAQEAWLFAQLAQATPAWIVSGAQFFGGYHRFESYEACQPNSFGRFKERLKTVKAPFAFVTGDRHLTELMKIDAGECGLETWELTTSAIHARTFPNSWEKSPNPRKVHGVSGALNYAVLDVESGPALTAGIRVYGIDKVLHYDQAIKVARGE
ncbi:MAG: alkaline phosphatase D family protein [Planctomycetota bacterium]